MAVNYSTNSSKLLEHKDKNASSLEAAKLFLKKKSIQAALILALSGTWAFVAHQIIKDKDKAQIQQENTLASYPFEYHHLTFWDDNPQYFEQNLDVEKQVLAPGVTIIRDAWLTFYVIQAEDIKTTKTTTYTSKINKIKQWKKTINKKIKIPHTTISHVWDFEKIRNKLSRIPEFSYLKDSEYDRSKAGNKTKSFNIPKESVKLGMYIPIPLDHTVREISPQDFANYCHDALQEMKEKHAPYSKDINNLLVHTSEKDIISAMLAFARSETADEYTNFIKPLGDVELHRREPAFKVFSLTYFHILMEKNADGKTPWPGLKARLNLWLTEWQCYHPKNAAKLFLAYRIEKTHGYLDTVFPLTQNNITDVWTRYNWSSTYIDKLEPNLEYTTKLLNNEITYYDNKNLQNSWFIYTWLNSKYEHVYRFKTPRWITSNAELKKNVVEQFNKNKASDCPAIHENDVVTQWGRHLPEKIIPDTICVCISSR